MIEILKNYISADQRPNLQNLSRGSNMVGSTQYRIHCFKIYAGAKLNPVFDGFKTRLQFIKFGRIR